MIKKIISGVSALLFLTFGLLTLPSAHADNSTSSGLTAMGSRAFNDLTRCISTKGKLDVYYLVDQSNSLPLTDPQASRAGILASSLKQLSGFSSNVQVNYAVGFFGTTFDPWKSFTAVQASTIGSEAEAFASEVASRDKQNDTNWLLGLDGAQKLLAAQEQVSHGCQALIWLTDGGLWLSQNGTNNIDQSAVDQAASTLCDTTFDAFRKSNVSIFGVLLDNTAALQQIYKNNPVYYGQNDRGMALMRPLIEGSGSTLPGQQSTTCGSPVLPNYSAGALLIAKDPIALALQFLMLGAQTNGGSPTDLPPGNPTSFSIEPGIRKFELVTTSKNWTLTAPDGTVYHNSTLALNVNAQDGVQQIYASGSVLKNGTWHFAFDSSGDVVNKLFLYSGLAIQLDPDQYIGGSKTFIAGQVVLENGSGAVNLKEYRTHDLHISQVTSNGANLPINNAKLNDDGSFSAPFNLAANQTGLEIRIELDVSTINGQNLAPISISKFLTVVIPSNYPTFDSPILLTTINGPNGIGSGTLTVHGPVNGKGQLCLSAVAPYGIAISRDSVDRASKYQWTIQGLDQTGCLAIAQGESKQLKFSVKNSVKADAKVIATVPVKLLSDQNQTPFNLSAPIDFQTSLLRAGRGVVKIALLLLGVLIPLFLLYLLNKNSAKFIFGRGIQRASYEVTFDAVNGFKLKSGGVISPTAEDFLFIPNQDDTAMYTDPIGTLRSRTPLIPLRAPWFEIMAKPETRIVNVQVGSSRSSKKLKSRFLSGQTSGVHADMDKFWAISVSEAELASAQQKNAISGTLVIFKRNKLSVKEHHEQRLAEVMTTPGIWARIIEMKQAGAVVITEKVTSASKEYVPATVAEVTQAPVPGPTPTPSPLPPPPGNFLPPPPTKK